jgi:hypothetical protein
MPAEAGTHDTGQRWAGVSGVIVVLPLRRRGRDIARVMLTRRTWW